MGLKPDFGYQDIYHIDYDMLYSSGIRLLFFDIDNTIAKYSENEPCEDLKDLFKRLNEKFRISIISNGNSGRISYFAEELKVRNEGNARKPLTKGLKNSALYFKLDNSECAMIGDQLFTDIWAGKNFKCTTVFVPPIDVSQDPPFVSFKRFFEKPLLKRYNLLSLQKRKEV